MRRVDAITDLLPATRRGEKWKDIEGYEGYYQVSSHGRIKSFYRGTERIRKQKITAKINSFSKQPYYECVVALKLNKVEKTHLVGRLVYHAFIEKLNFEKDHLMVTHKFGDGRNNHAGNLVATTRSAISEKSYSLNRRKSPFVLKSKKEMKAIRGKAGQSRRKAVQRLSENGKVLKKFSSIKEAEVFTGIKGPNIIEVLKGRRKHASGTLWQYKT